LQALGRYQDVVILSPRQFLTALGDELVKKKGAIKMVLPSPRESAE
jgi:hypothetical protein